LTEENNRATILKAVKDRVRQSEEQQLVQMLADAIGERRDRDLLDLLSWIEQDRGWSETLKHLQKAQDSSYTIPMGAGPVKARVENLKFRELLFAVLGCCGLEPIPINNEELLDRMKNESSLVDASISLRNYIESIARNQIESGDTLFFGPNDFDLQISKDITQLIEQKRCEEIQEIILEKKVSRVNITPLWQCETSRQKLSDYGIRGSIIDSKQLDEVLSVIQFPVTIKDVVKYSVLQYQSAHPTNRLYRDLLNYIINHDGDGLSSLSSKHSFSSLKYMLEEALDAYSKNSSSENYRRILYLIHILVRIRMLDSVRVFEELASLQDMRIATIAIIALGNHYHESSASALVEILCKSKNREIVKTATSAVLNVGKRCPETAFVVATALESSTCTHKGRLKRLWTDLEKKNRLYY
jgi:hypothetical protein